ncbi:MAG: LysM peptidoglycan-binding domain-containing protein [Candidatus Moraniibacteriota bacterium]
MTKVSGNKERKTPVWLQIFLVALLTFIGLECTPYATPVAKAANQEVTGSIGAAKAAPVVVVPTSTYTVKPGDQLLKQFGGKGAKAVCEGNKLANCDHIEVGQVLKLPEGITPRETKTVVEVVAKPATKPADAKPATAVLADKPVIAKRVTRTYRPVVVAPKTNDAGEILYRRVGTAPLNGCGKRTIASISEEAWEVLGLSDDDRVYLREHADLVDGPRIHFTVEEGLYQIETNVRLEQVTFCRAGKAVAIGPMRTAWDAKTAVYGERFVLPSGKMLVWMRNCFNWVILPEEKTVFAPPPPPAEPPVAETPPPEPEPTEPQEAPVQQSIAEVDEIVQRYDDWDLGFYAGGDRDVAYAGGEGAYYPVLLHRAWGRYAVGVGAFANPWVGKTPDDFSFGGRDGAVGLSQKWSTYERRDLGIKFPTIGAFREYGHDASGKYQQRRRATILCASASYNDASREKAGETKLPEWQVWTSLCDPILQSKSQTWEGQPITGGDMQDIRYILSVGGRIYLTKDLTGLLGDGGIAAKLQPFVEVGINKTSPFPYSAHLYGGLRTANKVVGCGAGWHYSRGTHTAIPGFTCTYDAGRHYKLSVEEERWGEMVKSLEALGVAVDD